MQHEIQKKIESIVSFLPQITDMPLSEFNGKIHSMLDEMVLESNQYPQQRESFRKMILETAGKDLTKGLLNKQMRTKPFGYAGDFQVIDWMYRQVKHTDLEDSIWDEFCNRQDAALSVINRKDYFVKVFGDLCDDKGGAISVLDLASGPCRDVAEAIEAAGEVCFGSTIRCVDIEPHAISYAQKVTRPYASKINFEWELSNVFRIKSTDEFDLTWSAGLFDYLNDRLAIALVKKMWSLTKPGGKMIVGNFHPRNPTRNYMEWCMDWVLIHRTEDELKQIGIQAGIPESAITIDQEPLGVCIFLVAKKGE